VSKPINAMAIGGFLIGGIALLITALLVFGGGQFFKPKMHWVVYFETSLNGLNVGAPVKVQGVQVGIVKEIELQLDRNKQKLMKPVVLEIEPWRLASPDGSPFDLSLIPGRERHKEFKKLIDAGLRARLEVQSILTGLLYVDLDFHPEQPVRMTGLGYKDMPEIPSITPTVDEVKATLEDIVKKIRGMPLDQMVADFSATLAELRALVGSEDTRKSQVALTNALQTAESLLGRLDRQLPGFIDRMDKTMGSIGQSSTDISVTAKTTTALVRDLQGNTGPMMKAAEQTLLKATDALESTRIAAENIADTTADDSNLQGSVAELTKAAQSLRVLTDYLERHPDSLLFGKKD
jgi:paraquat-inducible protein B